MIFGASWIGGHPGAGLFSLAIMTGFGLVVRAAGRRETGRGLRGDGRDERFAHMDLRATAAAGLAVLIALIVAWLVRIAGSRSDSPYDWLLAIAGLSYLLAIALFRWRS